MRVFNTFLYNIYYPLYILEQHVGMITFQSRLGAHLYVPDGIRGWWNAVDLVSGLLVEELGPAALVTIVNRVVRSGIATFISGG